MGNRKCAPYAQTIISKRKFIRNSFYFNGSCVYIYVWWMFEIYIFDEINCIIELSNKDIKHPISAGVFDINGRALRYVSLLL